MLSLIAICAPGVNFDIASITYTRSQVVIAETISPSLGATINQIFAAVGASCSGETNTGFVPATGAYIPSVLQTTATWALPDIWYPWDIGILATAASGSIGNGVVIYELDDLNRSRVPLLAQRQDKKRIRRFSTS